MRLPCSEPAFESLELKQIYEAAGAHPAMSCLQNDDGDLLIDVMLKEGPSQRVLVEKNVVLAEHGDRIGYYKVISIGKMYDGTIAEDDARKMLLLNREVKGGFYYGEESDGKGAIVFTTKIYVDLSPSWCTRIIGEAATLATVPRDAF